MVFSWAIARSAGLTGTSEIEAVLSRAVCRKENGLGLTLETESEPSLRLWRCRAVARFLISDCRFPIRKANHLISSALSIKGRNASGITIEPSAC